MNTKPFQSCLIPFESEIAEWRSQRPPMAYAHIAELLSERHQLIVRRETIFKFVKVRSRGRKAYIFKRESGAKRPESPSSKPSPTLPGPGPESRPKFEFTYSERYNLKRLPKEEAAAIRKKLEAEGH